MYTSVLQTLSPQGYKFNVFYPDLIDRQETPKYYLEKADHPGFAILRFHAGPPYEDIAFKVLHAGSVLSFVYAERCGRCD